jgi:hypothetical protein
LIVSAYSNSALLSERIRHRGGFHASPATQWLRLWFTKQYHRIMGGEVVVKDNLCLDGEFAGREVPFLLLLLERLLRLFVLQGEGIR